MTFYFPIAEMAINLFLLLGMGGVVGFLSGMFGVGGGFLMTPLLIFIGVPPPVAVATEANQITAASVSGAIAHWRRGGVDLKMGGIMIVGGAVGSVVGTGIFTYLSRIGQVDLLISLAYVLFLGSIGILMIREAVGALRSRLGGKPQPPRRRNHKSWIYALPLKMRFRKSRLYISALLPLGIGFLVGVMAAIMGIGGGFITVPAMIYMLGMRTNVVVGTSLFQIIFVTAVVTVLHAVNTHTVDVIMALVLLTGAVIGAQFGVRAGYRLPGDYVRGLLGVIVLGVCARMAWTLIATPKELYSLATVVQ